MLPGLAPASCAISRIETALKPLVENSTSAALRMASRILEFRVIGFDSVFICTNVQKNWSCQQETQDAVARRSNPCCFRAQEEFRVRLEAAGAHPRHQRRLGRHNPAAGRTRSIQGRGSASTTARTRSIRVGRTTPARRIFRFMPKYYADGDKACDRASLVTSKLAHDRQVQTCKKHRIRRPNQRNVVLSWQ